MTPLRTLSLACVAAGCLVSTAARADESATNDYDKQTATKEYTAPLSQKTQPSYVPQSVALSGPQEISDFKEGDQIPPGYKPVERRRKGFIIAGAVTFGSLYMLSAMSAAIAADSSGRQPNPLAAMWVPGVGPFIQMASEESAVGKLALAVDGIGQSAGIAMLIIGLTSPKTILVRNDLADNKETHKPRVRPVPLFGHGGTGVGLVGTF